MTAQLPRHELVHADGRRLYVYGELRGALPAECETLAAPELQLRRDLLTASWVACSPERNERPHELGVGAPSELSELSPFAPGGREVPFGYDAAVFENRFPSLVEHPPPVPDCEILAPSRGRCEVVLYTDVETGSLGSLPPAVVARVIAIWQDRSRDLWADPALRQVLVFENRGAEVGATISHPHGQIYAFDHVPPLMQARADALAEYRARRGTCLACTVAEQDDRDVGRHVAANDSFTIAVPFAARWPYEVHVRARRHGIRRLADLGPAEALDLARALREVVQRYDLLFGMELPYMMAIIEAPEGADDHHLAVEFMPPHRSPTKLKVRASVETVTGLFINDQLPDACAEQLRAVKPPVADWSDVSVPSVVHRHPAKEAVLLR
jgi:UDPglucose--hexose-1-phosphate uridylyltransferase